jgi:hypothetical protein
VCNNVLYTLLGYGLLASSQLKNKSNNHGVSPETSSQCLGIKDGGGDRVLKEKGI